MADADLTASQHIDELVAKHPDWRGELLAACRRTILAVDDGIVEEWKYMGAPVWSRHGTFVVGGVFKSKVKMGFLWGASLEDPKGLFNGELGGNQRRSRGVRRGRRPRRGGFRRPGPRRHRAQRAKAAARKR